MKYAPQACSLKAPSPKNEPQLTFTPPAFPYIHTYTRVSYIRTYIPNWVRAFMQVCRRTCDSQTDGQTDRHTARTQTHTHTHPRTHTHTDTQTHTHTHTHTLARKLAPTPDARTHARACYEKAKNNTPRSPPRFRTKRVLSRAPEGILTGATETLNFLTYPNFELQGLIQGNRSLQVILGV